MQEMTSGETFCRNMHEQNILSVSGNYYGTPRPIHISTESPPITYQEHRNLLKNFRTRSRSLSNLEKAAQDGEISEDDSGLSGKW